MGALLTTAIILGLAIKNYLENRKYAQYHEEPAARPKPKIRCKRIANVKPKPTSDKLHKSDVSAKVVSKNKKKTVRQGKGRAKSDHVHKEGIVGRSGTKSTKSFACPGMRKLANGQAAKIKRTMKRSAKGKSKTRLLEAKKPKFDYLAK